MSFSKLHVATRQFFLSERVQYFYTSSKGVNYDLRGSRGKSLSRGGSRPLFAFWLCRFYTGKIDEPITESTKFHTVDENSLGRFVSINKFRTPFHAHSDKGRCRRGFSLRTTTWFQDGFTISGTFQGKAFRWACRNPENSSKWLSLDFSASVTW